MNIVSANAKDVFGYIRVILTGGKEELQPGRVVLALGLLVVIGSPLAALAAWGGWFGESVQRQAGNIFIDFIDIVPPNLSPPEVDLDFKIVSVDRRSQREGFSNQECRTHESINLMATLSKPAYLLLINWDGKKVHPIDGPHLDPKYRSAGNFRMDAAVTIDANPGLEVIYGIASPLSFSYERDIKAALEAETEGASKGVELSVRPLILPDRFRVVQVHCQHVS